MAVALKKQAVYDDLFSLPDNMVGEIIDGELIATPRPSRRRGNSRLRSREPWPSRARTCST